MNDLLSQDSALKLLEQELLEKETYDRLYSEITQEKEAEMNNAREAVATAAAKDIANDPAAADLFQRVAQKVAPPPMLPPQGSPMPQAASPSATPSAMMGNEALRAQQAQAVQAQMMQDPGVAATQVPTQVQASPTTQVRVDPSTLVRSSIDGAKSAAGAGDAPSALSQFDRAISLQQQGIVQEAQAIRAGAAQSAALLNQASSELAASAQANQARMADIQAKQMDLWKRQESEVEKFNTLEIDPNRYWGSLSTTGKIMTGIGLALSAYAGSSKGFDALKKAIDDDIDIQIEQNKLRERGLTMRDNLLSNFSAITNDVVAAGNLARASMMDQATLRVQEAAQRASAKSASANAMQLMGKLQEEKAKALKDAFGLIPGQVAFQDTQGLAARTTDAELKDFVSRPTLPNNYAGQGLETQDVKMLAPGWGLTSSPEAAIKVAGTMDAYQAMKADLVKLKELIKAEGGSATAPWDKVVRAKAQTLGNNMTMQLKGIHHLGALDQGVFNFADAYAQLSDPLDSRGIDIWGMGTAAGNLLSGGNPTLVKLETMEQQLDSAMRRSMFGLLRAPTQRAKEILLGQSAMDNDKKSRGSK